ncbi:VOC family protein [Derxia lacustris]|uniref:VOC family protein n=1 Tax=Derxia lacustris TaxID=764842 RepID=UPI000A16CF3B|nr:VOC family protein [Derxia lacustris]
MTLQILGPDELVFGVDDVAACAQYLTDYGLAPVGVTAAGGRFEALDGTAIVVRCRDAAGLPAPLETGSSLRKTVYGVADQATLDAIGAELRSDREVKLLADGSLETVDDMGFALGFQLTVRRALDLPAEPVNAPGAAPQRGPNVIGVSEDRVARPRTLSHVVYFVPDVARAEAFYAERLGFRCTDRFEGTGPFLQPPGTLDHHTLFLIQTPPFMKGIEHFTFHMAGPTDVLQAGYRFAAKGYQSFWGPGRHKFGSNWFWYFNSPFGCHVEYDADMDLHDASWQPRVAAASADSSQVFLFQPRERWFPSGPPPGGKPAAAH